MKVMALLMILSVPLLADEPLTSAVQCQDKAICAAALARQRLATLAQGKDDYKEVAFKAFYPTVPTIAGRAESYRFYTYKVEIQTGHGIVRMKCNAEANILDKPSTYTCNLKSSRQHAFALYNNAGEVVDSIFLQTPIN